MKGQRIHGAYIDEQGGSGSVSIGPVGIKPGEDGWTVIGTAENVKISTVETERGPSYHSFYDPDNNRREQVRDFMRRHLGLELDPMQEQILTRLWPFRATQPSTEADYIKQRLNARLRGQHPGPYDRKDFI